MSSGARYGEADYWDKRYSEATTSFDWYFNYHSVVTDLLAKYDRKDIKILNIGCGNSTFAEFLVRDGYKDVTNVDISPVVIKKMEEQYHEMLPTVKWITMDTRQLSFESESFDVVFDKGTLDAILCGSNSFVNAKKMNSEVSRVLKPGGTYLVMTYGDPESRILHFEDPAFDWIVTAKEVKSSDEDRKEASIYHCYFMEKN
ncbi:putative Methyltransferase-like protein 13 C (METTL13C) [Monocercomonoides exilis]|uniref:putative Methyltransferase-like protein 13 C (METTL13C) n=1 Tax=Monocercomonoides exilis TaxID=2049356 RepID=UPI00355A4338|nr:putative Methyltransferase-like protein 13 C (METTL13C) [Monocercomonoides exilis]